MKKRILNSLRETCKLFILLCSILTPSCSTTPKKGPEKLSLVWENGKATGILVPQSYLAGMDRDSLFSSIEIRLTGHGAQPPIAGEMSRKNGDLIFSPLIPFTKGLGYDVYLSHISIGHFEIPSGKERPRVMAIYPDSDSVPENLLKVYFSFSKPMAEGQALKFISLRNERGDSLRQVFLDLRPELWNREGTILTLWFDPGRIKRGLQPNLSMGPPLVFGKSYLITVSEGWPDQEGQTLAEAFSKKIVTTLRDSLCPSPDRWSLQMPAAGTTQPFRIHFDKPMDWMLSLHAIHLLGPGGIAVEGSPALSPGQRDYLIVPYKPWPAGRYALHVESRLEDLGGNNLSRPFEKNLSVSESQQEGQGGYKKEIWIK